MTFLVRYTFTLDDGSVIHDQTVVAEVDALTALEKGIGALGAHGTLRVEFDPPLAPVANE